MFSCSRVSTTHFEKMRYLSASPWVRPMFVSMALTRRGIDENCFARSNEWASQKTAW